jgi:phosphonoacetaldehyde hydrolase
MDVSVRNKPYVGRVQAVVLDWAGTAVDYGCVGPVAVFIEVFGNHGLQVTSAEARAPMGLMKKDHIRAMCRLETVSRNWERTYGRLPEEHDVEAMYREVEPLMASMVARYSDPIPGLSEAVAAFRKQGIKVGSSTGYTRPMMEVLVPAAEKKGYRPDSIVCSSDVPAGRPYPWMCYQNAMNLQVYPFAAMVKIGDTMTDIQEGLNAGMWTIGVTKTGNELGLTEEEILSLSHDGLSTRLERIKKKFQDAGAHFVVESIGECPAIIEQIDACLAMGERP